ncbi:MAG: ABC transporter permease [Telluria sp.]
MKSKFPVVLFKELKDALRDKRALGLLAMFVLMYPALMAFSLQRAINRVTQPEREGINLTVIGADYAPTLMTQLRQKNVHIQESRPLDEDATVKLLHQPHQVAVLKIDAKFVENYEAMRPARLELWYDSAADTGHKLDEVERALREYNAGIASARLLAHGVSPVTLAPVTVQKYDTGTSASRSASLIGAMIGMFFFPAFMYGMSTAIDSTAGERERRSMEVLMAQPISPGALIAGKIGAAATLCAIGMTLELLIWHFMLKSLALEEIGLSWRVSALDLGGVILITYPLCVFAASFEVALAMNAKSFKEAQSSMTFAIFLPLLPAFIVPFLDLTTANWMYAVPVLSNMTLLRELSKGQALGALPYLMTAASALVAAALCFGFAAWRMRSEKYVLAV